MQTLSDVLSELFDVMNEIVSTYIECITDSGVDELISDAAVQSESSISSQSVTAPHINDEADKNYELAISRIMLCVEKGKLLLMRLGKVDLADPLKKTGELTKSSVSSLSLEIEGLNDLAKLTNKRTALHPLNQSRTNEVKLDHTTKDACNLIITGINKVIQEHNDYFIKDKSMQVSSVNLVKVS